MPLYFIAGPEIYRKELETVRTAQTVILIRLLLLTENVLINDVFEWYQSTLICIRLNVLAPVYILNHGQPISPYIENKQNCQTKK